jgi:hypothetical protein
MSAVHLPDEDCGLEEAPHFLPSDDDDAAAFDLLQMPLTPKTVKLKRGPKVTKKKVSKKPAVSRATVGKKAKSITFYDFDLTPAGHDLKMKLLTWPGQSLAKLLPNKCFYVLKNTLCVRMSALCTLCVDWLLLDT